MIVKLNGKTYGHLKEKLQRRAKMESVVHKTCPWAESPSSSTLCLKKVPTIKLSITLSNLNRFSKFWHFWKAYEICYKTRTTLPTSP